MAEAVGRQRWMHTSALMAMIANVNRDPKKGRAFRPSDFDPYARTDRRRVADKNDMAMLRQALEARKGKQR